MRRRQRRRPSSTWRCQRCDLSFPRGCQYGNKKTRAAESAFLVRPSGNAFLSGKSWRYFVAMHSRRGSGQENRPFAARCRRHASKMSWFWQDMLPMYSKCPAKRRSGIHLAGILPSRRHFPVRIPQIMHNGQILPLFCNSAFCARFGARPALRFVLHCGISVSPT